MDLSNDYKGRVSNDHNLWTDCNRMQQNQTPYLSIHAIPLQAPPVAQRAVRMYRGEEQTLLHELQVVLVEAVTVPFSVSSNAVSFGTTEVFPYLSPISSQQRPDSTADHGDSSQSPPFSSIPPDPVQVVSVMSLHSLQGTYTSPTSPKFTVPRLASSRN